MSKVLIDTISRKVLRRTVKRLNEIASSDEYEKLTRVLARLGVRRARYNSATDAIIIDNEMEDATISNLEKDRAGRWKAEVRHRQGYNILRGSSIRDLGREIEQTLR